MIACEFDQIGTAKLLPNGRQTTVIKQVEAALVPVEAHQLFNHPTCPVPYMYIVFISDGIFLAVVGQAGCRSAVWFRVDSQAIVEAR